MTNNADLIARLRRSPADTSQEFDAFVASYTGRDTAYHERNQTTGLAFARACWDAAFSTIANEAADALNELAAEVERLCAQLAKVNARCDHLGIRLGEVIKERDALRADAELITSSLAAALGWPGGISEPILDLPTLLRMVAELRIAAVGIRSRDTQPDRIESLRERHAQAMRDAARYRFVRTADKVAISAEAARDPVAYDAAIDAAIAAEKEQPQ